MPLKNSDSGVHEITYRHVETGRDGLYRVVRRRAIQFDTLNGPKPQSRYCREVLLAPGALFALGPDQV